jgi:hypothetical protein
MPATGAVDANRRPPRLGATRLQHGVSRRHHPDRMPVGRTRQRNAAEGGRPSDAHNARIGQNVRTRRPQEMRGLVDRRDWSIAVPHCRAGEQHRAVGQRHQRRPAHHTTIAAGSRAAPGCQPSGAAAGRVASTFSITRPRSFTHGARISASNRTADSRPSTGSAGSGRRSAAVMTPPASGTPQPRCDFTHATRPSSPIRRADSCRVGP